MFKFSIPVTIILSSGSLMLLAIGSLLLVSNTAYTSDIQTAKVQIISETPSQDQLESSPSSSSSASIESLDTLKVSNASADGRRRSGRLYGGQSSYGGQQQPSYDSYASAFAAGNLPSQDQSSGLSQPNVQANDASSFASFGESPPNGVGGSSGSAARQLPATDYGSPHASYYAGYMSPSSNSASYSGQQSGVSNYNLPTHHYRHQYHKSDSPPLGYPTNNYDRQSTPNYYDRSFLSTASTPMWASNPTSSGLMSSASSALSHWTGGFGITEIICGLVAIAIGAIILGAPFFLIYLALMGNFSGSGTLSLTNPTGGVTPAGGASTTVNGRRKRLAIFEQLNSLADQRHSSDFNAIANSIANHLSPFIDIQQVSTTFKRLINSIEKYSNLKPEEIKKRNS